MSDYVSVDFFTDASLIPDPYPYFDYLRSKCPVLPEPHHRVVAVTGYNEALAVYKEPAFSSCVSVAGPFSGLPPQPAGSDIDDLIEQRRGQIPMSEHIVTQDPPLHTRTRGLLSRLLTPKRLKENEDFMWQLADRQLDEFLSRGRCEFLDDYARPFTGLVIADLLGIPAEDHEEFRAVFSDSVVGAIDDDSVSRTHNPLEWLEDKFTAYVADRRREPRGDVLTELALARYPDGTSPRIIDVVRLATFLFAAGQETTTKLLSFGMRIIAEHREFQALLREDRDRIPNFIEETLRMESPVKSHFRLARTSISIGDVPINAGSTVMLLPGASNRDPRKFAKPNEFRLDRPNVREHVAFGRGNHSCPGAPLARAEARISFNRILDRMSEIAISEVRHGPAGARRYTYEPTWQMRGLTELHLEFTAVR
ncbi:cytochrome P450 [Mycobacterium heckeshornense]|uniref:Cytochrome P450 n=1 Tax=Mycobacterium heckeshornense TaxID=110505 RepID=A0A2G8B5Y8_9MYCO|nr:cytochrome P450 [Mycobacterium heckeshornense]KMV22800.1 cytochrome P450 [Mycobacterium heckeshornense]MCV7033996.1 cytochrome P450 [Mycobacterium heckeshornense]PIJ33181.1 cytochrome P450 [Mycobacterium heckeshornense]BCO37195.1 cytochrome P450 [Mycobacterium heckeshornense]